MEQAFKANWLTRRVGDELLVQIGAATEETKYQCVSLIKQYLREDYNLDVPYPGNAIQWWTATNSTILTKFYRVESSEAIQGDIVILRTNGTAPGDFSGYGHIGIATGNIDATNVEILEQNGATGGGTGLGGDAIRTRYVPRTRVAGLLRPTMSPVTTPTPPSLPYSIESIPSKDLVVKLDTHKWNLQYPDFNTIATNPVEVTPALTRFTAVAILHHNSGNDYYLQDAGITVGWNVKDCEDYVAPAPLPPPAPYVPPAAPVTVPMQTSSIYISNTVMTFLSATAALNHTNAQATVGPGKYIVYTTSPDGMFYINKNTGDIKVWINPADDVAPKQEPPHVPIISQPSPTVATAQTVPAVTQVSVSTLPKSNITGWRSTYKPFHPQAPLIPVKYVAIQDFVLHDLGGQRPDLYISEDKEFGLYGTFTGPDGREYLRAKTNGDAAFQYWYGVPMQHPEGGVGYVVTAGILEIFPKPIQHGYIYGVATVEKAIDIVWKKFTKKQGVRK